MAKKDNWNLIEQACSLDANQSIHSASSSSNRKSFVSNNSTTTSSFSSSSSKSKLGQPISLVDKAKCIELYGKSEEAKMWKLSTGRYVEQIMMQMLVELEYEQ